MYEASRSSVRESYDHRNDVGVSTGGATTSQVGTSGGASSRSREHTYRDHTSSTAGRARSATYGRHRLVQDTDELEIDDSLGRVTSSSTHVTHRRQAATNSSRKLQLTANMTHTRYDIGLLNYT